MQETPDLEYRLIVDGHSRWLQEVELTRDEFIALKQHLATMRGYTVPQEATHA
jgi:hypothetical protein